MLNAHALVEVLGATAPEKADPLNVALGLAELGIPTIPLSPSALAEGRKAPLTQNGLKDRTSDKKKLRELFTDPAIGLAFLPAEALLLIIDVDKSTAVQRVKEIVAELIGVHADHATSLDWTVTPANSQNTTSTDPKVVVKRGTGHLYVALPDGVDVPQGLTRSKLERYLGVEGVDVLGGYEGYVVAPPTKLSGYHYRVTGDILPYTNDLHEMFQSAAQHRAKTVLDLESRPTSSRSTTPAERDQFTAKVDEHVSWDDLLPSTLWTPVGDDGGCSVYHYAHASSDKSVTVHGDGPCDAHTAGGVTVFSATVLRDFPYLEEVADNRSTFTDTPTFTKFQFWVGTVFHGDVSAAVRKLGISHPDRFDRYLDDMESLIDSAADVDVETDVSGSVDDDGYLDALLTDTPPDDDDAPTKRERFRMSDIAPTRGEQDAVFVTVEENPFLVLRDPSLGELEKVVTNSSLVSRVDDSSVGFFRAVSHNSRTRTSVSEVVGMSVPPLHHAFAVYEPFKVPDVSDIEDDGTPYSPHLMRAICGASQLLAHCYDSAQQAGAGPLSYVAGFLRDVALHIPPSVKLPALSTSRQSPLNWMDCALGKSGAGKSGGQGDLFNIHPATALRRKSADDDEPTLEDFVIKRYPSVPPSGPALAAIFAHRVQDPDTKQFYTEQHTHSAYFEWDESDTFVAMMLNEKSGLNAGLRTMWSGGTLGSNTKIQQNALVVHRDSYRSVSHFNSPFDQALVLVKDGTGGFAQRVFWFGVVDPNPLHPDERDPSWVQFQMDVYLPRIEEVGVCAEVRREVAQDRHERVKDQTTKDERDDIAHRVLMRLRAASYVALAHGLPGITPEVWKWSGFWMEHSRRMRDLLESHKSQEKKVREFSKVQDEVHAEATKHLIVTRKFDKYLDKLREWVKDNPDTTLTRKVLSRTIASALVKSGQFEQFLTYAEESGVLEVTDTKHFIPHFGKDEK